MPKFQDRLRGKARAAFLPAIVRIAPNGRRVRFPGLLLLLVMSTSACFGPLGERDTMTPEPTDPCNQGCLADPKMPDARLLRQQYGLHQVNDGAREMRMVPRMRPSVSGADVYWTVLLNKDEAPGSYQWNAFHYDSTTHTINVFVTHGTQLRPLRISDDYVISMMVRQEEPAKGFQAFRYPSSNGSLEIEWLPVPGGCLAGGHTRSYVGLECPVPYGPALEPGLWVWDPSGRGGYRIFAPDNATPNPDWEAWQYPWFRIRGMEADHVWFQVEDRNNGTRPLFRHDVRTNETTLVKLDFPELSEPGFDASGRYVVWTNTTSDYETSIHAIDAITRREWVVSLPHESTAAFPRTAGDWIVYSTHQRLVGVHVPAGTRHELVPNGDGLAAQASFDTDGKRFAVWITKFAGGRFSSASTDLYWGNLPAP